MTAALLIVNADDFGLTPGVNRGIVEGFERGIVRSTSMLAVAPAFDDAVRCWRDLGSDGAGPGGLGVGVHFALVGEDPPLSPAKDIRSLVDGRGRFWPSWKQFLPRAALGRIDPGEVRLELAAQLARILDAGISPTHVDTHQHLHLWPVVRRVVFELAQQAAIDAIRVPRATAGGPKGVGLAALAARLSREASAYGLRQPARFAGLDESGRLDRATLRGVIEGLSTGQSTEIGCHPGLAEDPDRDRYRWGFQWPAELEALCDPTIRADIERRGFVLGSFAAL